MRNLRSRIFVGILAIGLILGGSALRALPQETTGSSGPQVDALAELEAWNKIKNSSVASDYHAFLKKFPNGALATRARERMNTLGDPVWDELKKSKDPFKYRDYIKGNPDSPFLDQAQARFDVLLRNFIEWEKTKATRELSTIQAFIKNNPKNEFVDEALKTIEPLLWQKIQEAGDFDSLLSYRRYFEGSEREKEVAEVFKEKCTPSCQNQLGMEFQFIPSGTFMMGSTDAQVKDAVANCRKFQSSSNCGSWLFSNETPQRLVTISQGFWMGRHEVTQGQYEAVMGRNPSQFKDCGKDCPVDFVFWDDAKEFIKRLNDRSDWFVYSLPSEAEWEYAARAGTTTAFAFRDSLSSTQANFLGIYPYGNALRGPTLYKPTKVGSYSPNAWGLYDMHGNVRELVEDIYTDTYDGLPTDGSPNTTRGDNRIRVARGGSWDDIGYRLRSAKREPSALSIYKGFRVVARLR
jgi:formylglycine-generating enzyme required for sulfatase activity